MLSKIIHIDFALNIMYQSQQKQHKRKVSEGKNQKRNCHENFQSLTPFQFSTKMVTIIVKMLYTREILSYIISAEVENS